LPVISGKKPISATADGKALSFQQEQGNLRFDGKISLSKVITVEWKEA
jgi:hypothetical protein